MNDLFKSLCVLGVSALCMFIGFNRRARGFILRNVYQRGRSRPLAEDEEMAAVWGVILIVVGLTSLIVGLTALTFSLVRLFR